MEFKVIKQAQPTALEFNYEELKAEIEEKAKIYEAMVYTEENVADAKKDRATLNKLKTALNDERKRREKEYMMPFEDFKKKVNEIISIIDKPVEIIDKQVKEFENAEKALKRQEVEKIWDSMDKPDFVDLGQIWLEKWLNKSCSLSTVKTEMEAMINGIRNDMSVIENLTEFSFEAMECYKRNLNLSDAVNEGKRLAEIQKRKAEAEEARKAIKIETTEKVEVPLKTEAPAETGKWVCFKALLTTENAYALRDFFRERGIEFRAIKEAE